MIMNIIKIGTSKGLRIPKPFLKQCQIEDRVNVEFSGNKIIISPLKNNRRGWEEAAKKLKDNLVIPDSLDLDSEEWEWK